MNNLCVAQHGKAHELRKRGKRVVVVGSVLLGVILVSCVSPPALSSFAVYSSVMNSEKVDQLERNMLRRIAELESLRENDIKVKEILGSLTTTVAKIDERLSELNVQVEQFKSQFPKILTLVANMANQFFEY